LFIRRALPCAIDGKAFSLPNDALPFFLLRAGLFIRRALPCAIDEKAFSLPNDALPFFPLFDKRVYWNPAGTTLY
jgi:hypothetical protein